MSTLHSRILRYGLHKSFPHVELEGKLNEKLASATVVKIDNVAEYIFTGTDQEEWKLFRDIPSVAPPWPNVFMEYRVPKQSISKEVGVVEFGGPRMDVGVLLQSYKVEDIPCNDANSALASRELSSRGIKWITGATLFVEWQGKIISPVFLGWGVGSDGTPIGFSDDKGMVFISSLKAYVSNPPLILIIVAAMAICFCNCAKTKVVEHSIPDKLNKSHIRKCGIPMAKYHTIEIEAVNRILKNAEGNGATGIKQALHICRGHFKDYRERGLFGKVKGVFWWDMSVRGNADHGVVEKDYHIAGEAKL